MNQSRTPEKSRLGRGLSSLIPKAPGATLVREESISLPAPAAEPSLSGTTEIPIAAISPNTFQPRRTFEPGALAELTNSIREHGVLQPIMVRSLGGGHYELVAGERRLRASEAAGLTRIPAIVRTMDDAESLTIALIENIQREDLNAVETGRAYRQLLDQFHMTQTELAKRVGKSQAVIANLTGILKLPDEVLESIVRGEISAEHGRVLLSVPEPRRIDFWRLMVARGMTVKEARFYALDNANTVEAEARSIRPPSTVIKDVHWQSLEDRLRAAFGLRVSIKPTRTGRGSLVIEFASPEEAEGILDRLGKG